MVERPQSHERWFLIFLIFLIGAVAFLDRVNISIAGKSIAEEFHFSNIQLGWIFSAFQVGYAIFQTPGGRLVDRLGARRVVAAGIMWWGVFTAFTAAIPSGVGGALLLFFAVRVLLGTGEAIIYPASNWVVANWIPTGERGIANGVIFAGVGFGAGITPPLVTYIMIHAGWRWSFWISALIGIAVGFVWFAMARDTPEEHPRVSGSELAFIRAGLTVSDKTPVTPARWRDIFRSKEVWALTFSYFTYGYVAFIFFSWFFIYLATVRGLNLKTSAYYSMLPFLAMATGSPLGGAISDLLTRRWGKRVGRCGFAVFGMGVAAVFIALGSYVHSGRLASVVLAGGAGALYLAQSIFWSVSADIAGRSSGSVSGFMNTGAQIGGVITATLTPAIASWFGWSASFVTAAGWCALGALAWLLVDPTRALSREEIHSASP